MQKEKPLGYFGNQAERSELEIKLPSGRSITVMETTGKDESLFSNMTQSNIPKIINKFFMQVTKNLDGKEGSPSEEDFDSMLQGDRTAILINCRLLTHGNIFEYSLTCSDPSCGATSEHEVNLDFMLESLKPYPNGDVRESTVDIDGNTLYFELPNGYTEKKLFATRNPDPNRRVQCLKMWENTPKGKLPVSVDMLKSSQLSKLRKALRSVECSVDTVLRVDCPTCGRAHQIDVLTTTDFLFPHLT